jgi:hypothetical protein
VLAEVPEVTDGRTVRVRFSVVGPAPFRASSSHPLPTTAVIPRSRSGNAFS